MSDWLKFFFKAMSGPYSYAGGGKAVSIPGLPGYKGYRVQEGPYLLTDYYTVLPDGISMGYTTQWENGQTRLQMDYGGFYPKFLTPFLREVLLKAYQREAFHGGRGRDGEYWRNDEDGTLYQYHNELQPMERGPLLKDVAQLTPKFKASAGFEWIGKSEVFHPVGYHYYHYLIFEPNKKA